MTPLERIEQRQKAEQYIRDATTRFKRACRLLRDNESERGFGYTTEYFMWQVVSELLDIVELLPEHDDPEDDYQQEDIRRDVQKLHSTLKSKNLAKKLERTNGRTPEEQAAFQAKAAELRG